MTEVYSSSLRPSPIPDIKTRATYDDTMSTPRRSVVPSDFSDLSPLDALAAQGRLLNKRLTQHGRRSTESPPPGVRVLDDSVFPKFGVSDTFDNREFRGYEKRNRVPEKRRGRGSESPQSPVDSLSIATLSLLAIPQNPTASTTRTTASANNTVDSARSESQASSFLSLSTSSEGSETPTERVLTSRIYQPPQKIEPPKLRPIIKTQQLARPYSPAQSPSSSEDQTTPIDLPSVPRSYTPQLTNSLDRPRLPSLQTKVYNPGKRTPSINFSRPYSSRSSAYSDASSAHEVDYFSAPRTYSPADDHLSIPQRSPSSESTPSSPGISDEDFKKLPRGRRKSRPVDTGVFFHSKSIRSASSAHRWPQTPVTPTHESLGNGEKTGMSSSPAEDPMPRINHLSTSTTFSVNSTGTSVMDIPPPPPLPRPATSGALSESPRLDVRPRQARSVSQDVRRPSMSPRPKSQGSPQAPFTQQSHPREFSSPTQILNPSRSTSISGVHPFALTEGEDPNDHVALGIKYHQQDLLPQATHQFQLAAESGEPTGMLFYSLSLRHGWGCAANPEKAVEWLHSAAETASAQVDENGVRRPGGQGAYGLNFRSEDGKRGGATLALAIYELGQSYMHGWGVAKDKHLALRCYEISANFGDTDGQW